MKKLILLIASLSVPALALGAEWQKVSLVDQMCREKEAVKANPDKHPTSCLLKCASSGYGIITADGGWLKLDDQGNKAAVAALKGTKKADHVRVNVTGEQKGDTIAVKSLTIPD